LSRSPDASANSVAHDRNFISSGEPKTALSDGASISSTVLLQKDLNLTLCARTAREAKCFAAVASALFRCREADLSRGGARQVQMPGAGLRARIYRWFWAIGCSSNTLRDDLNQERATSGTLTFGAVTRAARLQIRRFRATQRAAERSPSISA